MRTWSSAQSRNTSFLALRLWVTESLGPTSHPLQSSARCERQPLGVCRSTSPSQICVRQTVIEAVISMSCCAQTIHCLISCPMRRSPEHPMGAAMPTPRASPTRPLRVRAGPGARVTPGHRASAPLGSAGAARKTGKLESCDHDGAASAGFQVPRRAAPLVRRAAGPRFAYTARDTGGRRVNDTPAERGAESTWTRLRRRKVVHWGIIYVAAPGIPPGPRVRQRHLRLAASDPAAHDPRTTDRPAHRPGPRLVSR
jgi:hypothetical protein